MTLDAGVAGRAVDRLFEHLLVDVQRNQLAVSQRHVQCRIGMALQASVVANDRLLRLGEGQVLGRLNASGIRPGLGKCR